jgi:aromatic ring hydroxylase
MKNSLYSYSVYQSIISGINIVEINLEILTSNFDLLTQEDKMDLFRKLESAENNLNYFSQFFSLHQSSVDLYKKSWFKGLWFIAEQY